MLKRNFTPENSGVAHIYESVKWTRRDAIIKNSDGKVIFKQESVEFPEFWSDNAVNIFASRYFWGKEGSLDRECSLRDSVNRIIFKISSEGKKRNYFKEAEEQMTFEAELAYLIVHQMFSLASPVWFNIGTPSPQTPSSCFIVQVDDNLESILETATTQGKIYSIGAGSGFNASRLRGKNEPLSHGGQSSGPLSFMRIYDELAKTIKSGGRKRRSSAMVCMNVDHPDIEDFISIKSKEEKKAKILIKNGYDASIGGEAYESVGFQNENHSAMIPDKFMKAVRDNAAWALIPRTNGMSAKILRARDLFRQIATHAWETGDPGVQFYDEINRWDTCTNDPPIESSNPCGEYLFKNNTSCNLSSFNIRHYFNRGGSATSFIESINLAVHAMNILIDFGEYPTEKITEATREYRPIGIGFCDMGGFLMSRAIPFASKQGLDIMSIIMATITLKGYEYSALLGEKLNRSFPALERNFSSAENVVNKHTEAFYDKLNLKRFDTYAINPEKVIKGFSISIDLCRDLIAYLMNSKKININHLMNAQISAIAPTGTIGLIMDSSTTGIEPEFSLIKYKYLSGGGMQKYVSPSLTEGLRHLGYTKEEIESIIEGLESDNPVLEVGEPYNKVFATAIGGAKNVPIISPAEHIETLAAVQPFVSGAISKTVNVPSDWTVEQIEDLYIEAFNKGLKSITVYRDGCKGNQPLKSKQDCIKDTPIPVQDCTEETPNFDGEDEETITRKTEDMRSQKKRLPSTRHSLTHKTVISGQKCYFHAGLYEDGTLGEIFISMANEGSFANGLMATLGRIVSLSIQWGVPLDDILRNLKNAKFEPYGITSNKEIQFCSSVVDYLGKWIEQNFNGKTKNKLKIDIPGINTDNFATAIGSIGLLEPLTGSICSNCGSMLMQDGKCLTCPSCGTNTGCGG